MCLQALPALSLFLLCCLLGNPSLRQSQQGNGSKEENLLCRNIPMPFQYVLYTAEKILHGLLQA